MDLPQRITRRTYGYDYAAAASMVRHGFAIAVVPRLAWPADTHGVARLSLRGQGGAILARHILLAQRTGRTPALVAELRHHLIRSWPHQQWGQLVVS